MVPESHGGQPRENDRLGGREAPSGTTGPEAHHELEALVLEARLFQDPIVTFLGDILHEGAHGVSEIDTGANVPETAKAPVDAREVGLQSEDLRCLAGARLGENRRLERIDMRGHGRRDGSGSAIDRATWIASVIEIGIVKETELGTGSAILIGETRGSSNMMGVFFLKKTKRKKNNQLTQDSAEGHALRLLETAAARERPHLGKRLLSLHEAHLIGHALDHQTDETTDFNPSSDIRPRENLDHRPRYRLGPLRRGQIPNHNHNLQRLVHPLH